MGGNDLFGSSQFSFRTDIERIQFIQLVVTQMHVRELEI